MSKRKIVNAFLGAALLSASPAGAAPSRAQAREELREEFHLSYPLAPGGRVSLENVNGAVRITAWGRDEVKIDGVKRAYTAERLAEAKVNVEATADAVRVKTQYPQRNLTFRGDAPGRYDNPASVEYALTVPRGARLDGIKLVNGGIDIDGVAGEVNASSVNGGVSARRLAGRARLSTVNGGVEAVLDRLGEQGNVELTSVNGPVTAVIPSDAAAELRASTVHGPIENDFGLPVRHGRYVGRELAGRLGAGGPLVKLSNVNGPVSVRRARDGRAPSPAVNLLSEARGGEGPEAEAAGEIARGVAESIREAQKELAQARVEIDSEARAEASASAREARRKMARERVRIEREAEREATRAARDAERETTRAAREAAREARRATRELSVGAEGGRLSEQQSKSFPVGARARVRVQTFSGRVTVRAWDKPEVTYTAYKRAADEHEMSGINLRAERSGDEVVLAATFDKSSAREVRTEDGGRVVSFSSGAAVNYEVFVPRGASVSASSGEGGVSVEGVGGEIEALTGDGPVEVSNASGRLRAQTGDGRVSVNNFEGEVEAQTGAGRIALDGRFTRLSARTGDGSISLALSRDVGAVIETDAETVVNDGLGVEEGGGGAQAGRRVRRWRVGGGGNTFTLRTGDGHVVLRPR